MRKAVNHNFCLAKYKQRYITKHDNAPKRREHHTVLH